MKIVKSETDIKIKSTAEEMWSCHCFWCENAISTQTRTLPEAFNSALTEPFLHFYKIWIYYDILSPCGTAFLCMVEYNWKCCPSTTTQLHDLECLSIVHVFIFITVLMLWSRTKNWSLRGTRRDLCSLRYSTFCNWYCKFLNKCKELISE